MKNAKQNEGRSGVRLLISAMLLLLVGLGAACGNKVDLPVETRGGTIPLANAYRVTQIWTGVPDAYDVLLTSGNLIFLSEPDSGRVRGYFRSKTPATPNGIEIMGLGRPTFLAEGIGGHILIADEGDTNTVLEYNINVQPPQLINTFVDVDWDSLGGIEADLSGNLFVAVIDFRLDNRGNKMPDRVVQYEYSSGFTMVREALEGTGTDFVTRPAGLAHDLAGGLFVIDQNWVRRWTMAGANFETDPNVFTDGSTEGNFSKPLDVAVDGGGYFYVADTGGGRVLKYDDEALLELRVDEAVAAPGEPGYLIRPRSIAVNEHQVYVIDGADGKVVTFELN